MFSRLMLASTGPGGGDSHRRLVCIAAVVAVLAGSLVVKAAWIPLKAEVAQMLLQHSWQAIRAGRGGARPWPWADTRPVAILRVPRLEIEQFVLEGHSGRNLAFGPVLIDVARSGDDQILSGHRDTHFRFLQRLVPGDLIELETPHGPESFIVSDADIIDSRRSELVIEPGVRRISLVTCYPFDAVAPGGPLRFVVTALPSVRQTQLSNHPHSSSSG